MWCTKAESKNWFYNMVFSGFSESVPITKNIILIWPNSWSFVSFEPNFMHNHTKYQKPQFYKRCNYLKRWVTLNDLNLFTKQDLRSLFINSHSQLTFNCSKSTVETLEKGAKYVQLTIKRQERRQWRRSGIFIVNFEHI